METFQVRGISCVNALRGVVFQEMKEPCLFISKSYFFN